MSQSSESDELGVSRWDGLAQFTERHPINTHGCRCSGFMAALPHVPRPATTSSFGAFAGVTTIYADYGAFIVFAVGLLNREVAFEKSMTLQTAPLCPKTEHRAAKRNRVVHRPSRLFDILDHPRYSSGHPVANFPDQFRSAARSRCMSQRRVTLARRRRPNEVETIKRKGQCVSLNEGKRVAWLWIDIDANNFKTRLIQTHARAARTATQIESLVFGLCQHLVALNALG